jgi:hypothetical protein
VVAVSFDAENGAGAFDELLRLAKENSSMAENTPIIARGQVWASDEGGQVTVQDFAEYTCGWMVRVEGATPDLLTEDEFRATYRLLV